MAAPLGNQNAAKAKRWTAAIERALERSSRVEGQMELDALADDFLKEVRASGITGFKELGDRLEGKPAQTIIGPGDAGEHTMITKIEEVIVDSHG